MRVIIALIVFLCLIWIPVILSVYIWKTGLIMTILIVLGSYFIDKYLVSRKNGDGSKGES